MKRIFSILIFLSICAINQATHNRAGQILYKHVSGYTYDFILTTFTYTPSAANAQRHLLEITWGDNTVSQIERDEKNIVLLPDNYSKNTYYGRHTFPGAGVYTIVMADPNRNVGVQNIPNSETVVFSVKTILKIDPNTGVANSAPELLTYPIDKAALGQRFVHNPSAYDIDGDSLSYELAICTREKGIEIESYSYPEASTALYVDPIKGDLVWDAPTKVGIYNIAMKINEWRHGIQIGSIARDMQIEVIDSKNRPPELPVFKDTCVIAGVKLTVDVKATDPDNDQIVLTATGGPFQVPSPDVAKLEVTDKGPGFTNAVFTWQTNNSHVRKQPYTVTFKAEDQNSEVKLVSFTNYNITVLAPKIENMAAVADKKSIRLSWSPTVCTHAAGYEIYRSIGKNDINLGSCGTGIPAGSGYEKVATVDGINVTTYEDTNNGKGLSPGIEYCYRVVAYFSDGAKSLPSDESCAVLLAGTPPMIRADVEIVDPSGKVNVAWLRKPLDEVIADKTGDFEYRLFYTDDLNTGNWTLLYTTPTPNRDLKDTTFIHQSLDTKNKFPYYYKVELRNASDGTLVDDDVEIASTLYPVLQPSDQSTIITFGRYAPWVNTEYEIYRCDKAGTDICIPSNSDWVGRTNRETYTDTGLKNGQAYCYRIQSKGYRNIGSNTFNNENWSHVACVTPYDNVPPCAPTLTATSLCDEGRNLLEWTYDPTCMSDVEKYRIYFTSDRQQSFAKIDSVMNRDIHSWSHRGILVGCYYVTAVDSAGNESLGSNIECLDECGTYELPNVFTPNGDNINDIFKSFNPGGVTKVDMKIYNRWGKLVFKTEDPAINWDGRDIDTKRFAPTGVYYYTCDVYEERLTGSQIIPLSGFIHLYYGSGAQPYAPPVD